MYFTINNLEIYFYLDLIKVINKRFILMKSKKNVQSYKLKQTEEELIQPIFIETCSRISGFYIFRNATSETTQN